MNYTHSNGRDPKPLAIIAILVVAALILSMLGGCATGTSDRGSTGDTRGGTVIQKGIFFGGTGYAPHQDIDTQSFDVVADAIDQQIASLDAALVAASEASDAALVTELSAKIAALRQAKSSPVQGNIVYIDNGDTSVSTSGTASAASPGDTQQTPSTQTNPNLDVTVTPVP